MQIGHVHLKVRDLGRSVAFYQEALGLTVTEQVANHFAFMTGTSMHHELALQQVGEHAKTPGRFDTGLFHTAFEVGDKKEFARAFQRLREMGIPVATVDHRISWAVYFSDPDGNGLEIYVDTRKERGIGTWDGIDEPLPEDLIRRELC
ncbi:MAG: VOC family protein [Bdellovibrionales bacterium]|nr:VOC family protein [Bdellovibrionales bacterium]